VEFRWNDWNVEHIAEHGVSPQEAELVIEHARPPYPELQEENKWRVVGRGYGGRWLQVVFVFDPEDEDPETEDMVYVIHARPLTDREKRRERRKSR
jgi:uncharacterized DUF497 family protein